MPERDVPDLVEALLRSVLEAKARREARAGAHEHKWKVLGCARCQLEWKEDHA